jgi:PAS domain S-box-containing protein
MVDEVAAARPTLEQSEGRHEPARTARAATWHWDLASDRVEWDERLKALFGYAEMVTDAAWRVNRIHPEDRDRVEVSLQRAAIEKHGAVWSDEYRFRQADGSYATVTERAYVLDDDAGPRWVFGAITPTLAGRLHALVREDEVLQKGDGDAQNHALDDAPLLGAPQVPGRRHARDAPA